MYSFSFLSRCRRQPQLFRFPDKILLLISANSCPQPQRQSHTGLTALPPQSLAVPIRRSTMK
jgi:hypothetical protein